MEGEGKSPASRDGSAQLGGHAAWGGGPSHTWERGGVEEAAAGPGARTARGARLSAKGWGTRAPTASPACARWPGTRPAAPPPPRPPPSPALFLRGSGSRPSTAANNSSGPGLGSGRGRRGEAGEGGVRAAGGPRRDPGSGRSFS